MSEGESAPEAPRGSPVPGCIILATILLVFGGLVVLYTFVGNYQKKQIAGFTEETAAEIPVIDPNPSQIEAAMGKLAKIEAAVADGKVERVLFTAEDLDVLLATLDTTADFRGQTYIDRITEEGVIAEMAQPVRKGIIQKGFRYLNGEFTFKPEIRARTIAFKVVSIRPAVGSVPQPFVDGYSTLDFFRLDPENETIAKYVDDNETIYTEPGQLVVETRLKPREGGE